MSEICEKLTLEMLKRIQQRLERIEQRCDRFEAELATMRSCAVELDDVRARQLSMLADLHYVYAMMARASSGSANAASPSRTGR